MTWFWERATWQRKLSATSGMENSSPCVSATPESMSRAAPAERSSLLNHSSVTRFLFLTAIAMSSGTLFQCWNCLKPKMPIWSSCCKRVADVTRYGSVALDQDGRVTQFVEKGVAAGPGLINAGVYLLRKQIVRGLPAGTAISLETEVFPRLLDRRVYGLVCTGLFIDIGIPDDLRRAQALLTPHTRVNKPSQT